MIIPQSMHPYILKVIHQTNSDMVKCKQLARYLIYWQGMNSQIEDVVSNCTTCQQHRRCQQKEPRQNREVPNSPWCDIATDLFERVHGDTYLVVVDAYSEYIEIKKMTTTTSMAVIRVLSEMFATHCFQITDIHFLFKNLNHFLQN